MKSFFFANKARTPTANSFNRMTHSSPICQYFDNSPIVKQVKNEHMTFSRFAGINNSNMMGIKQYNCEDKLTFDDEVIGESKVIEGDENEDDNNNNLEKYEFNRFDFFAERNDNNTSNTSIIKPNNGNEINFSSFIGMKKDSAKNTTFTDNYSNSSFNKFNNSFFSKSNNNSNPNSSFQDSPLINVNININNNNNTNNNNNFIYPNNIPQQQQPPQQRFNPINNNNTPPIKGFPTNFSNYSNYVNNNLMQMNPNYPNSFYQENPMKFFNPQQNNFFNIRNNFTQMAMNQFTNNNIPQDMMYNSMKNSYSPYTILKNQNCYPNFSQNILSKSNIKKITNQNYTTLNDEELAKQAHIIAKYQSGCRYLQKKIEENPELAQSLYYPNILEYIQELSTDQFGNFYIKKLFQFLSEEKLLQFIAILFPILPSIGANQYGARVLQDLIDFLTSENLINSFIKILIPHIDILITDQNGSHVIYKLLCLTEYQSSILFFYEHILNKMGEIASSKKGCIFIQKCLEILPEEKLNYLIKSIEKNLFTIITNKYGNYIVQSILAIKNYESKKGIYNEILKNVCFYSNQKYSSNVMEKCFDEEEVKERMINEILNKEIFEQMLLDNFGNYVIQRGINSATDEKRNQIFNMLVPLIPQLQKKPFGQKLLSKLFIQYPKLAMIMLNLPQ